MRHLTVAAIALAAFSLAASPVLSQSAAPDAPKATTAKKKKPAKKQAQVVTPAPAPMNINPASRPGFMERQGSGESSSFGASGGLTSGDGTRSGASVGDMGNR